MSSKKSQPILDKAEMGKCVSKIADEILSRHADPATLAVIGIQTRGVQLAERIVRRIKRTTGADVPLGTLDITLYRDDIGTMAEQPVMRSTSIEFDVTGKTIVLVDDVLFNGRTVRAALDQVMDFGRPERIELAVLIDRGHRELPIQADYVGTKIETGKDDSVNVSLREIDGVDKVEVAKG